MTEDALGWTHFALALIAFLGSHSIPAQPPIRRRLVGMLGEKAYLALYSLMSLALLFWLFVAAGQAPYVEIWPAETWQRHLARVLVPLAFALGAMGLHVGNPLSLSVGGTAFGRDRVRILHVTRHPVLWALALWAFAHLLANGDLAHVILFGVMLALSIGGMAILDRRAKRRLGGDEWLALTADRPFLPFAKPRALRWLSLQDVALALVGLLLAVAMMHAHQFIIGVPAI